MAVKTYILVFIDFHKNQKGMLHNAWELAPFGSVKWWNLLSFSFKAIDCLLTDENLGLIEPGISILIFSVFVDEILKGKPWDEKNTHSIVCLFQCRIPQQAMGLINCFQDQICVYVCVDFGDKEKVYFFFFPYTERNKQYFSDTATQFSNRMDFRAEMHVQGSQTTSGFPWCCTRYFKEVSHPRNMGLKTTTAVAGSYKFWYCSWWQCPCNDWYCECWCTISQISKDKWKGLTSESKTQCTLKTENAFFWNAMTAKWMQLSTFLMT